MSQDSTVYLNCPVCKRSMYYLAGRAKVFFPNCSCDDDPPDSSLLPSRQPDEIVWDAK